MTAEAADTREHLADDDSPRSWAALACMLRNGGGSDLRLQSLALAYLLDRVAEVPTRDEMRAEVGAAIAIHCKSCDAARDDGGGAVLSLGKGGLSAEGRVGVRAALWVLGLIVVFLVALGAVAPRLATLVAAWR